MTYQLKYGADGGYEAGTRPARLMKQNLATCNCPSKTLKLKSILTFEATNSASEMANTNTSRCTHHTIYLETGVIHLAALTSPTEEDARECTSDLHGLESSKYAPLLPDNPDSTPDTEVQTCTARYSLPFSESHYRPRSSQAFRTRVYRIA